MTKPSNEEVQKLLKKMKEGEEKVKPRTQQKLQTAQQAASPFLTEDSFLSNEEPGFGGERRCGK